MINNFIEGARGFMAENQARATEFATTTGAPTIELVTRPDISPALALLIGVGGIAVETIKHYVDYYTEQETTFSDQAILQNVRSELAIFTEESTPTT